MSCRSRSTIVCCLKQTLCLSNDGNVCSFGFSRSSNHGHEEKLVGAPKVIPSLKNIKSVVCKDHTVCLDFDGNVYTFGNNADGKLGVNVDRNVLEFTHIPQKVNLPPCKEVSCGENFTICLTDDGMVYSFGNNEYGELGLGNYENYNSPQLISSLKDVEFIECGGNHTFCKTLNNEIYSWGYNNIGQLGLENTNDQYTPILCSSLSNEDVVDIKCGKNHTLVLTSNGDVLSCGWNYYHQLGRDTASSCECNCNVELGRVTMRSFSAVFQKIEDFSEIIRIECGINHSLCIDINYDLYVFGNNGFAQLGLGDTKNRNKPMKHPSLSNIIDVSNGGYHTFVKTSNNEIYAFGNNKDSQLGIKTENDNQITPIRVFEENEDIWFSNINKSKAKSARF